MTISFSKVSFIRTTCLALALMSSTVLASSAWADTPEDIIPGTIAMIMDDLSNEDLDRLDSLTATIDDPVSLEALAHAMLMQRHLDEAAYLFTRAVEMSPERASALTALGAVLVERLAIAESNDLATFQDAVSLQENAAALMPNEAAIQHNLGTALLRLAQAKGGDDKLARRAVNHLQRAADASPQSAMYSTRLAEALRALEEMELAASAVNEAFVADPLSPSLEIAMRRGSLGSLAPSPSSNMCAVNFECASRCPGGIIGGLNRVTCEMHQSSAQLACMDGQPHAIAYNCDIEIPRFGIMIPGLYPGFSAVAPWGSIDVLVQGGGNIDWQVKLNTPNVAGFQFYAQAEGRYNPYSGVANWDMGGGVQYAMFHRNEAMRAAQDYDLGPQLAYHINPWKADPDEVRFDFERGPLLTM